MYRKKISVNPWLKLLRRQSAYITNEVTKVTNQKTC